jgi:CelD/BcsL family acetyltransferase involved in cellulose biosynthesis
VSGAEFVGFDKLAEAAPEWADLCARAAEANPFAEPGFLLPLMAYQRPRRLAFALIRGGDGRLIGLAALTLPRVGLARVWMSPYAALPAGALDRDAAPQALAALVALLSERTRLVGLVWPFVERDGPLAAALDALALPGVVAGRTRRAALRVAGAAAFDAALDPKRRKKWAQQARKLAARGRLDEVSGDAATEALFAVERLGWKGRRGTALADDPARAAFARAALAGFARAGRLEALALRLDGAPIAAGVALQAGDRAFYWKTAYDEAHAETSPGVQLTLALSRRLAATPGLAIVDSCALPDHPMINRVWADRLEFEDRALGLRPGSERPLRIWVAAEMATTRLRETLKRGLNRALRRKTT